MGIHPFPRVELVGVRGGHSSNSLVHKMLDSALSSMEQMLWEKLDMTNQGMDNCRPMAWCWHDFFQAVDIQQLTARPLEPLLQVTVSVLFYPCGNPQA